MTTCRPGRRQFGSGSGTARRRLQRNPHAECVTLKYSEFRRFRHGVGGSGVLSLEIPCAGYGARNRRPNLRMGSRRMDAPSFLIFAARPMSRRRSCPPGGIAPRPGRGKAGANHPAALPMRNDRRRASHDPRSGRFREARGDYAGGAEGGKDGVEKTRIFGVGNEVRIYNR